MRATVAVLATILVLLTVAPGVGQERRTPRKESVAEPEKPGAFFEGRAERRGLETNGGNEATERAVDAALDWLARHQDPEGFWDADGFAAQCRLNQCSGPGAATHDVGVTGLATLAFLGRGETHREGDRKEVVRRSVLWLVGRQNPDGCVGLRTPLQYVYDHAFATLALVEAFGMTQDSLLRDAAQKAVAYVHKCQNPYLAWRYGERTGENDTSVSACMTAALYSARRAGLEVGHEGFDGMKAWLDKVTEPEYGRAGYTARGTGPARGESTMDKFPPDKSESLTAAGILCRIFCGEAPAKSEMIAKGTELCMKVLPVWEDQYGRIDMYYWYWGTLALFQVGGDAWATWNESVRPALVDHQRKEGDEKGSWDPIGPWGKDGGRIYSTALCAMSLEVYYRYPRIFKAMKTRASRRLR